MLYYFNNNGYFHFIHWRSSKPERSTPPAPLCCCKLHWIDMALSITTFFLVFSCLTLASRCNGGSKAEPENQHCGNEKFYCPTEKQCFDRELRCTASNACAMGKCYESSTPGKYTYYKKRSLLLVSRPGKRKRRVSAEPFHWFVEYRGFVYEFGGYGFQELDINDPNYKYGPKGKKIVVYNKNNEKPTGSSTCTRDQILTFKDKWLQANSNYHLIKNNCQDFAKQLLKELKENCASIEGLKAPSACYTSSSFSWKLHALFAPLILFAIFRNIN